MLCDSLRSQWVSVSIRSPGWGFNTLETGSTILTPYDIKQFLI